MRVRVRVRISPHPHPHPSQVLLAFLLKSATQSLRPLLARLVLWPLRLLLRRKLRALRPPRFPPGGGTPAGGEPLRARSRWQQVAYPYTPTPIPLPVHPYPCPPTPRQEPDDIPADINEGGAPGTAE